MKNERRKIDCATNGHEYDVHPVVAFDAKGSGLVKDVVPSERRICNKCGKRSGARPTKPWNVRYFAESRRV